MKIRAVIVAAIVAAAIAAAAAACGVRVTPAPSATPSAPPSATSTLRASPSPSAAFTASPSPSSSPTAAAPTPAATPSAEETAAARRAAATEAVQSILPQFGVEAQDIFTRSGVPGAAVAVVAGDQAVYVNCFGVREAGAPEKVDKDTVFQLASISKSFTATMLAALVSAREIGWDDPVHTSWPEFALWDPWVSDHVTIRDLMAQRSGLPAYAGSPLRCAIRSRLSLIHI